MKNRSKCELCGSDYNLSYDKRCKFSCQNGLAQMKSSPVSSLLFIVFSFLTIVYIAYCGYLNSMGELNENLQLILLIVGIFMIIVILIILGRWTYLYFFITVCTLLDVEPVRRKVPVELTQDSLNQSQQDLK